MGFILNSNTKRNPKANRGVHDSFFGLWPPLKKILAGLRLWLNFKLKAQAQTSASIHKSCWSSNYMINL
jgi:hypothetical protein